MRKTLAVVLILLLGASLSQADIVRDSYENTKARLTAALDNYNVYMATELTEINALYAEKLGMPGVVAWRYNNLGYMLLNKFILDSGYVDWMAAIDAAPSNERNDTIQEAKTNMREYIYLLFRAQVALRRAKTANDRAVKVNEDRTNKIQNNLNDVETKLEYVLNR